MLGVLSTARRLTEVRLLYCALIRSPPCLARSIGRRYKANKINAPRSLVCSVIVCRVRTVEYLTLSSLLAKGAHPTAAETTGLDPQPQL